MGIPCLALREALSRPLAECGPGLMREPHRLSSNWCPCRELKPAPRFTRAVHRLNASGANVLGAGSVNRTPVAGFTKAPVCHWPKPARRTVFRSAGNQSARARRRVLPVKSSCRYARTRRRSASSSIAGREGIYRVVSLCLYRQRADPWPVLPWYAPFGLHGGESHD